MWVVLRRARLVHFCVVRDDLVQKVFFSGEVKTKNSLVYGTIGNETSKRPYAPSMGVTTDRTGINENGLERT